MSPIASDLTALIGRTPMCELNNFASEVCPGGRLVAKLEYFNPAGSIKDRVALNMLADAERRGLIAKGSVIIEPTSGNTGIGLAFVAAVKGYRVVFTMPGNMSAERRRLLAAYGAEIILTDPAAGMAGAIAKARELKNITKGAFIPGQFENPANPASHYDTTGPEIWNDTDGKVEILVAGVGTGGTASGAGKYLKQRKSRIKVIAVEPADSPVLSEGKSGPHTLQGLGAGFVPETLERAVIDEVIPVSEEDAFSACRLLAAKEGLLAGISSGAAMAAAVKIANRQANLGRMIVVILPDGGDRYLSTPLFDR